jgi:hypothetical protein
MIDVLKNIEAGQIADILRKPVEEFKTLLVDYEPPVVERLQYNLEDGYRLFFHVIHQCETKQALYHPHPWPSAMHILSGSYEMGMAYSEDEEHYKNTETGELNETIRQNQIAKMVLPRGTYYEMLHKKGWHYVRPLETAYTVMLTHTPWYKGAKATKPLSPLKADRAEDIREHFLSFYS